jgi:PKD repeat protein
VTYNGIKVPCFTKGGKSYLRVRGSWSGTPLNKNSGCGYVPAYGNIFDIEVNLKVGSAPVAGFIVPTGPNWMGSNVAFNATSPNAGASYKWTFSGSPTVVNNSATKGIANWSSAGKYDVKMLVDYCGIADSITKQVTITAPTSAPTADFIADNNEIELGFNGQLFDLSTNGPTKWLWEINTPTGVNNATATSQNPVFTFVETGYHDVCLTATNSVGASTKTCKSRYINCLPTLDNYLGPQHETTTKYGRLFDHAGPTANYSSGRKTSFDYFQILPCGAKKIMITFKELKLADANDKLHIYDAGQADPNKEIVKGGITGANQSLWDTATITLTSGTAYITFETDGSGQAAGFIMNWNSVLDVPTAPKAKWTTDYKTVGNGASFNLKNATANTKGIPIYTWTMTDGTGFSSLMSTQNDYSDRYYTDGTYKVCLFANTCTGIDSFCDNITIETPTAAKFVDYTASNLRPVIGELVSIATKTDYADNFEWSIFPTSYTFEPGSNKNSQNPNIRFSKGGAYTFTLSAWNATGTKGSTEKKVIKNKYIIVLDYCTPLVNMVSGDVAINELKVTDKTGKILVNNITSYNGSSYNNYTDNLVMNMTFGASYNLDVLRLTNSNSINYKAWVDWNIDGDFDDAGEEILSSGTITGLSASTTFTVPNIANSFEGKTRMRIGASYGSFSNTPCGVNQVGEFEDYAIVLANDNMPPMITLVGSDTVRVERSAVAGSCYAEVAAKTFSALDATEGDMTSKVTMVSDLDCKTSGVYSITFDLTDASGNKAQTRTRTVIVVLDRTGPVLTLQGNDTITVEQCGNYTEPGAVANDAIDGDLTSAIKVIGSVDASKTGNYNVVYSVKDAQSNFSTKTRLVRVVDTKKPSILRLGSKITDGMTINVQINNVFVDDIYAEDPCNGNIFISKNPGYFGVVNNQIRNTYPIVYRSTDPSGNKATEDGFTVNYRVDDYIAPTIELNTGDTVYHPVNAIYSTRSVSVNDNYYPVTKISLTKVGTVDAYTLGTYVETFTATDESGNSTVKKRFIKVVDQEAPRLTAPAVSVCIGTPFWANSGLIIKDNYYSPSDLMPLVKVLSHNVNVFEAGVYFINYSLIDPSGNEAAIVSRTVYVAYPPNCTNTYSGTTSLTLDKAITVYPNPTSGKVNVSYTLTNNQPMTIEVTNSIGAIVANKTVTGGGFGVAELNLSDVTGGVYFVRLTNNGETTVKKLVVNN